jgi:hypothetical protein
MKKEILDRLLLLNQITKEEYNILIYEKYINVHYSNSGGNINTYNNVGC